MNRLEQTTPLTSVHDRAFGRGLFIPSKPDDKLIFFCLFRRSSRRNKPARWRLLSSLDRFPDLSPTDRQNGLTGLGNALRTVGALLLMCDPRDLGVALTEDAARTFEPNLFLYDNYPGGIGQSAPLYKLSSNLLEGAAALLAGCACESGCLSCVGPAGEIGDRGKEAAARILAELNRCSGS